MSDAKLRTRKVQHGKLQTPPRILVVENDSAVLRHWSQILAGHAVLQCAPTFAAAWEATSAERWRDVPCDYVFLELRLPDGNGEDLLDRLAALCPRPGVAVVTGFLDARRALALHGRCGIVVPKPADQQILLRILTLLGPTSSGDSIIDDFASRYSLSFQERRLLFAAVRETSNDDAASELGCSCATVRTYWGRIFRKTGCTSAREVVVRLLRFALDGPTGGRLPSSAALGNGRTTADGAQSRAGGPMADSSTAKDVPGRAIYK
jgi:DNA-binding NarL/FixJ family response regulator